MSGTSFSGENAPWACQLVSACFVGLVTMCDNDASGERIRNRVTNCLIRPSSRRLRVA
jgi:hypothetical protein